MSTVTDKFVISDALAAVHARYSKSSYEEDKKIAEQAELLSKWVAEPGTVRFLHLENIFYAAMRRAYVAGKESK